MLTWLGVSLDAGLGFVIYRFPYVVEKVAITLLGVLAAVAVVSLVNDVLTTFPTMVFGSASLTHVVVVMLATLIFALPLSAMILLWKGE